jgi:N-acetylglucosamine-6-phosphate deacetylase
MSELLLYNAQVILTDAVHRGSVLVRDGRISGVFASGSTPTGLGANEMIDLAGSYLAPGMIDIHIHGSAGVDVQATDEGGLARLSRFLLAEGVTGYFATFVPTDERSYKDAIATVASYIHSEAESDQRARARVLGIHFEGPFVSKQRCGALKREHFRIYDGDPRTVDLFAELDMPRIVTLAPEIEGGVDLTRDLTGRGVRAFIGHSEAEAETLDLAAGAGARHITHFPNALDPLHHRKPGAVGWGLVRPDVTIDCIADFQHVHPLMLRLMYQAKGADSMALISDAILPTGLGDGEFTVWGVKIAVTGDRTAIAEGGVRGTIAGSVITMNQALKNIVSLGVPVHEAVRMSSLAPARAAGVERDLGSIEEGKRADLIVLDETLDVRLGISGGTLGVNRKQ